MTLGTILTLVMLINGLILLVYINFTRCFKNPYLTYNESKMFVSKKYALKDRCRNIIMWTKHNCIIYVFKHKIFDYLH